MVLSKRVEVLLEEHEYEELRREATRRGISLSELLRDAVRRQYIVPSQERRRQAFEFLTSGPEVDIGSWEDAKKLIGRYVDKEPDP